MHHTYTLEQFLSTVIRIEQIGWDTCLTLKLKTCSVIFACEPKYGKRTWIGLFSTPNGSIIGDQWKDRAWHVYVIIIVSGATPEQKGKKILIWDCDPVEAASEHTRWHTILWGKQRSFVEYLRNKRGMKTAEIRYNTDATNSGRNECLILSLQKVWELVQIRDSRY